MRKKNKRLMLYRMIVYTTFSIGAIILFLALCRYEQGPFPFKMGIVGLLLTVPTGAFNARFEHELFNRGIHV